MCRKILRINLTLLPLSPSSTGHSGCPYGDLPCWHRRDLAKAADRPSGRGSRRVRGRLGETGPGRDRRCAGRHRLSSQSASLPPQPQNRHRVAPPGSTVASAVAVRGVRRYTYHGGGPAEGALNSAVRALPVSSTRAGHPSAAQRAAIAATVGGSVIWRAVPSTTSSKSWAARLSAQRGSRARLRAFRVRSPVSNQKAPSAQRAPMPVTWGLASGLIVVSQHV